MREQRSYTPRGGSVRLLERSGELSALGEALAAVVSGGQGRIVLVAGEAGIGKTALLHRFCAGLGGGSARVLRAGCDPLFTPRPLGPVLDLAGVVGGELAACAARGARPWEVAAALLRELAAGPSVLVLEDVHWADEATLDVIRLVGRRVTEVPMLLVLSWRDDELDRAHPLRIVLGDLPGSDRVTRLALAGLSPRAVAELAGPAGVDAGELHQWTAGNPFFVTEVLAAGTGLAPRSVQDAVLGRAARLGPAAREVLDAAAVVPGPAELWLLDALAPSAAGALDECLGAGMIVLGGGRVEFRHEIARHVVEESLPPGRRAVLHSAALAALSSQVAPDLARLAHHAEAAGDGEAVLRFAPAAAERAAAAGARREAAGLYARALRFAGALDPAGRAGLLERFAAEAFLTSGYEGAAAALREAVEIHRARRDLLRQGDALRQLAQQLGQDGVWAEGAAALAEAVAVLEQVAPGPELARAYSSMAASLGVVDDDAALLLGQRAIELAERVGCLDAAGDTLNVVGTVELRRGNLDGLVKLDRSRELAAQAGDELGVARAYAHPAAVLAARREWVLADCYIQPGLAFCRDRGLEAWRGWLTSLAAEAALARGRWDEAASIAAEILAWRGEGFSQPGTRVSALVTLARVGARRGEPGYQPFLDEAVAIAKATRVAPAALLIAATRAEAAWLEGAPAPRIGEETEPATELEPIAARWWAGELEVWHYRAGLGGGDPSRLPEPYRLEITGDAEDAARWWQERGCTYEAALALAGSGDPAALRRALDMLHGLGARPAAAVVARRLHALGELGVRRGPRPATAANPAGLTGRETEVLRLLAAGLSNTEIAVRLVLSGRTVDRHVSAIFGKLGVRTRGEAGEQAARLGPPGPSSPAAKGERLHPALIRDLANPKGRAISTLTANYRPQDRGGSMRRLQTGGSHTGKTFSDALCGAVGRLDGEPVCSSTIRREA
jgi:DNA-binding CsgD family transcriptional regulator/tetratricopeptide (TPR) repeat protein